MANTLQSDHDDPAFWLPTHFLTDDDFFIAGHSALDSPVSSTAMDDEFLIRQLAQFTLQDTYSNSIQNIALQKQPWVFSTSPQSTLTGMGTWSNRSGFSSNGSPNGPSRVPSPPVTPPGAKSDAAWELLYEAAGQVARLKMNAIATAQMNRDRGRFLEARRNPNPSLTPKSNGFYDFPNNSQFQGLNIQVGSMRSQGRQQSENLHCHNHHYARQSSSTGALGLPQSAWPPLSRGSVQPLHRPHGGKHQEAGFLGGDPGIKRQSAGTGVFLPRIPGTQQPPSEPRRNPAGGSPLLIPARIVQSLNLNLDEINTDPNLKSQPRFSRGLIADDEMMMMMMARSSRRNGAATMAGHHETFLPSDWTY